MHIKRQIIAKKPKACGLFANARALKTYFSIKWQLSFFALAILSISGGFAHALTASEAMQLNKLDPQTRIEQRCDIEAMNRLGKEKTWRPDKVLAYAFSDPIMSKHTVKAKGAAFRSGGKWYRLSYICKTQDDFLTIKSFEFKTGDPVPRQDWDKHYLVP
ncbi:DUF930 domain-containing protein [Bartonella sp. HY329]|uniref:DUF930 domain-containing protein n=1 Tax=unclassified Bartonella TaxID=2645622 RepID=UPI0021CA78E0|nr:MULTISPECIES: DUF930 domain-containing protein [unclassified Bartonella]UXM95647.1 DUF930 domain-containing protein [Bartonella sp. HY329]UXN09972.1 DUF930 domain-containing protein [Bartonella sp. HY328]